MLGDVYLVVLLEFEYVWSIISLNLAVISGLLSCLRSRRRMRRIRMSKRIRSSNRMRINRMNMKLRLSRVSKRSRMIRLI